MFWSLSHAVIFQFANASDEPWEVHFSRKLSWKRWCFAKRFVRQKCYSSHASFFQPYYDAVLLKNTCLWRSNLDCQEWLQRVANELAFPINFHSSPLQWLSLECCHWRESSQKGHLAEATSNYFEDCSDSSWTANASVICCRPQRFVFAQNLILCQCCLSSRAQDQYSVFGTDFDQNLDLEAVRDSPPRPQPSQFNVWCPKPRLNLGWPRVRKKLSKCCWLWRLSNLDDADLGLQYRWGTWARFGEIFKRFAFWFSTFLVNHSG